MIVFEVLLNDQLLCTAGGEDLSILTAMVTAAGKLGPRSHGAKGQAKTVRIDFDVGGLTSRSPDVDDVSKDEHVDWSRKVLAIGDEVRIRIVDSGVADRPKTARPARAISKAQEKSQFEWAKAHYFSNRSKYERRASRRRKSD